MADKAVDQITIVDLSDGVSVEMSLAAYAFPGTTTTAIAGSVTTLIQAFQGETMVPCSVDVAAINAYPASKKPTGITLSKDSNANTPMLTITASTSFKTAGPIEIPVQVGDLTIVKSFAASIAFKGTTGATGSKGDKGDTGAKGDKGDTGAKGATGAAGKDALSVVISSSVGNIFRNSEGTATLTAQVFKGPVLLNDTQVTAEGTLKWYKDGTSAGTGKTLTVTAASIVNKAVYSCKLEG